MEAQWKANSNEASDHCMKQSTGLFLNIVSPFTSIKIAGKYIF